MQTVSPGCETEMGDRGDIGLGGYEAVLDDSMGVVVYLDPNDEEMSEELWAEVVGLASCKGYRE